MRLALAVLVVVILAAATSLATAQDAAAQSVQPAAAPATAPVTATLAAGTNSSADRSFVDRMLYLPPVNSVIGHQIDTLFHWILALTTVIFIGVQGTLLYFAIRYRHRPGRTEPVVYSHGNNKLEVAWTIIPSIIMILIGLVSQGVWDKARLTKPKDPVEVRVLGQQFAWNLIYPGVDGQFDTADDFRTTNFLRIPVGKTVMFHISSQDVLHSFFLPTMRIKQDALPRATTPIWVTPENVGNFEIACAEFCGISHGQMRGTMEVVTVEDFDKWVAEESAKAQSGESADEGYL